MAKKQRQTLSPRGWEFIKQFEGFSATAYQDTAGVWTIGYGTAIDTPAEAYLRSERLNNEQAEDLMRPEVERVENWLNDQGVSLNQNQFDALVSFAYNVGLGALEKSTLWRKVEANPKDKTIAAEFVKWRFAGDGTKNKVDDDGDGLIDEAGERKFTKGLLIRREAEAELYFGNVKKK